MTQRYSPLPPDTEDDFLCDFSLNMVPGQLIAALSAEGSGGLAVMGAAVIGRRDPATLVFTPDAGGRWGLVRVRAGSVESWESSLRWLADTNGGRQLRPFFILPIASGV